jgi:hypothetical protein
MQPPKPYFHDLNKVKAILLGADPSNETDKGKAVQLEYVFGIGGKDKRYFMGIKKNLAEVGLTQEEIYAQNLVQEYQMVETGKNKSWKETAEPWVEILKQELDAFDPGRTIPVLVTAQAIIEVLSHKTLPAPKAIYLSQSAGIVQPEENRLCRTLLPFYRHYSYALGKEEYKKYRETVKKIVS